MSIHNYLRPLWSNGPHVVHEASPDVRTAFGMLFRGRPRSQPESIVQLHRVRPLDVTVAWLELEVEIPVAGTGLSYRRARYLHAFATDGPGSDQLTSRRARALFEDVYGEDLVAGVHAAQGTLVELEYPAMAAEGRALFVSERLRSNARRAPAVVAPVRPSKERNLPSVALETLFHHPDALLFGEPSSPRQSPPPRPSTANVQPIRVAPTAPDGTVLSDVDLLPPLVEEAAPHGERRTPVEAFDRAFATRDAGAVDPDIFRPPAHVAPPAACSGGPVADRPERATPPGESVSLSTLLRARLVERSIPDDANETTVPHLRPRS